MSEQKEYVNEFGTVKVVKEPQCPIFIKDNRRWVFDITNIIKEYPKTSPKKKIQKK